MSDRTNPAKGTPTKDEHDEIVEAKGRPFTDHHRTLRYKDRHGRSVITDMNGQPIGGDAA